MYFLSVPPFIAGHYSVAERLRKRDQMPPLSQPGYQPAILTAGDRLFVECSPLTSFTKRSTIRLPCNFFVYIIDIMNNPVKRL